MQWILKRCVLLKELLLRVMEEKVFRYGTVLLDCGVFVFHVFVVVVLETVKLREESVMLFVVVVPQVTVVVVL